MIRHVGKARKPLIHFKYGLNAIAQEKAGEVVRNPAISNKLVIDNILLWGRELVIEEREMNQINGFMEVDDWSKITLQTKI